MKSYLITSEKELEFKGLEGYLILADISEFLENDVYVSGSKEIRLQDVLDKQKKLLKKKL